MLIQGLSIQCHSFNIIPGWTWYHLQNVVYSISNHFVLNKNNIIKIWQWSLWHSKAQGINLGGTCAYSSILATMSWCLWKIQHAILSIVDNVLLASFCTKTEQKMQSWLMCLSRLVFVFKIRYKAWNLRALVWESKWGRY